MSFFLIPIEVVTRPGGKQVRQEKYVPALGVDRAIVDFGDTAIVWANCDPAQEASVAANADVTLIPPLDNNVAVNATKAALENLNVPAQWVTAGMTYRTVLRVTIGMAQLIQRASAILGTPLSIPGNLDKTISQFSVAIRNAVARACDELVIDRTDIVGSTTLREALRDFGQQFAQRGVTLGDL